MSYSIKYTNFS